MRFMVMHKLDDGSPEAWAPSAQLIAEMGELIEESVTSGVLIAADGLRPSSEGPGARITYSGGKRTVVDGPFTEAKEVIAGYAVLQVQSRDEAVEWADRFAKLIGDVEVEVRLMGEPDAGEDREGTR